MTLLAVLSAAVFFGVAVIVIGAGWLFLAVAAAIAGHQLWTTTLVLAVDRKGVRFGGRGRRGDNVVVPWSSIRQVVVWNAGPAGLGGGVPEVGLRLRPDAPMPSAVGSLIHDPDHPDDVPPVLRIEVRDLDRDRLDQAVQAHGGGVPLVNA
jgi:hypothetical protein